MDESPGIDPDPLTILLRLARPDSTSKRRPYGMIEVVIIIEWGVLLLLLLLLWVGFTISTAS